MADHEELLECARRAGKIAQAIFYTFIEHTWSYDVSSVRVTRDEHCEIVHVEVVHAPGSETRPRGKSTCEGYAGGLLFRFPQEAFTVADLFAKHALLADGHSVWAFVFMHAAVQALFEGMQFEQSQRRFNNIHLDLVKDAERDIKEVVHYVASDMSRIAQHSDLGGLVCNRCDLPYPDEDAKGNIKGVYCITLKDGTRIALDLAGAQYSLLHETVVPWSVYLGRCVNEIKYRIPFRSHHDKHIENMDSNQTITRLTVITQQMASINALLTTSDSLLGSDIKTLLSQKTENFQDAKNCLQLTVSDRLTERANNLDTKSACPIIAQCIDFHGPRTMTNTTVSESVFLNLGNMSKFDWSKLSEMVKMKGGEVTYQEKKKARTLLQHRCVYRMPGDWRLVFLADKMPSAKVPGSFVSENPYWLTRK
jgi:hypothetical protein